VFNLRVAALAVLLALGPFVSLWLSTVETTSVVPGTPTISTEVVDEPEEDEPGFDCRIHGNRICGPTELAA
jgi:hypothetical protein